MPWVFDPDSGGVKIPDAVKRDVEKRIQKVAEEHFKGRYTRLEIRFRSQFCYIDAYTEPAVSEDCSPELFGGKSREERIEYLRDVPTHLCRLRFFGDEEKWSMAFFSYASMKYEPCIFDNGAWHGTPEEAFDCSAIYLTD